MASDNSLIEQATENYQLGDFNQAAQICRELVKADPNDYEALHLLGIILHKVGLNTQAAGVLKQALVISGQQVSILHNYGLVLKAKGEFAEATVVFRQIVSIVPTEINSWYNYGSYNNSMSNIYVNIIEQLSLSGIRLILSTYN